MKRLLAILILILAISSAGCISDGDNLAPSFAYLNPEGVDMKANPYDTLSFSAMASDPNGDDIQTRWYVDDVFIGEGSALSYSFSAEDTYEVKAVIDDGEYNVPHSWYVDVEIDVPDLMEDVSLIRGLQFYVEVPFRRITREELSDMLEENFSESEEDILNSEKVLRAFHAWGSNLSLKDELIYLYTEGVEGFYDMSENEFVLVDEDAKNSAVRMVTLAHELIHVLQDQNYDVKPLLETDNDDAYLALTSLIEGDATYFEIMYLYGMQNDALTDYFEYYTSLEDYDVEPIVEDMILFPYIYGLQFVEDLVGMYGVQYLENVYEDPPSSTEQIMHPEKYISGEAPEEVELPEVDGMTLIEENVLGEANIFIILDQRLSSADAEIASS
ncbi:MAG: hypothetical protein JW825_03240, partial [Candidatus Methanofastidiosa archaeon]|nr:hypothetical protein [Candidatus Methanofastidiosa archaeon]